MNLVIDVGNTLIKLGVFDYQTLKLKKTCIENEFLITLEELVQVFPKLKKCIISSVANLSEKQLIYLKQQFDLLILDHTTEIPFTNKYATPKTLGIDRIALVSAAVEQYSKKNVLIIDAGTCITYDFLNSGNEYLGGAISPGIAMRYKALNTFTAKLPLLEVTLPKSLIGNSTETSINSGIVIGVLKEIDGFITEYRKDNDNLTVILTGGDAHFLRDSIKNDIFANSNFLLEGLNHILEYNKH